MDCIPHSFFEEFSSKKKTLKYLRFLNSSYMTKHSFLNYLNNARYNVQTFPPHYVIPCIPLQFIIFKFIFLEVLLQIQIISARVYK